MIFPGGCDEPNTSGKHLLAICIVMFYKPWLPANRRNVPAIPQGVSQNDNVTVRASSFSLPPFGTGAVLAIDRRSGHAGENVKLKDLLCF